MRITPPTAQKTITIIKYKQQLLQLTPTLNYYDYLTQRELSTITKQQLSTTQL